MAILIPLAIRAAVLPALMPLPVKVEARDGRLPIRAGFRIAADAPVAQAAARLSNRIAREAGLAVLAPAEARATLTVECRASGAPVLGEDESYILDVTADGAQLRAASADGALHGMETFAQLVVDGPDGFFVPGVHIEDRPRFPWRGLMLDVSRQWMPVEVVKRNLDAMAAVKLNVFHWHLSDDQGFRVETKRFPKLHELGSDGHFYTQAQVREVVEYARERGIRVVPEFDMPGHTTSWFVGYPELASAPGPYAIERHWGIFKPTMNSAREETFRFLDDFLGEVAGLFPDPYFHIGGDEVETLKGNELAAFTQRIQQILTKHGKTMVGWDEVMSPGLAKGAVIQSWRGPDSLAEAARQGYRGILSFGYYLDHMRPASFHYAVDPPSNALGGEACMWVEYASAETVDSRIWPRMAAIAERFWSPREVKDVASMYNRMEAVSRRLEWVGLRHRANYQPMLERLAGGQPVEPVRVLADAVEALGIEGRRDERVYTSLVDLNRLVDAGRPESEPVRLLEIAAKRRSAADLADLRATFRTWAENDARFEAMSALLIELRPLSRNLSATGAIGLRALEYLEKKGAPPEDWLAKQRAALEAMSKPQAEVVLAAVRPVKILLNILGGQSER